MHTRFNQLATLGLTALLATQSHGAVLNAPKRDVTPNNALPSGWKYSGCFTDTTNPRTLHADGYADDSMTESTCINYCNSKGYSYAGIEYGRECYCDNRILDTGAKQADSECSFTCPGSGAGSCGAGNRMSIFTNGNGLSTGPVVNPGFDNWKSLGCYTDSIGERTLEFPANVEGLNSAARCTTACQQAGYTYAGLEYGQECYCGSSLRCPSAPTVASACNMACNGNTTEVCGGPNAMNVYQSGNDPLKACNIVSSSTSSFTSTSTSTSSTATPTTTPATLCPKSNNTIYTDATGQRYTTYCGFDYGGGNLQVGDLASYELCLQACDALADCGAVAWTGGDDRGFCYLKEANSALVSNANVIAAIRIPATVSSSAISSSAVSSSVASTVPASPTSTSSLEVSRVSSSAVATSSSDPSSSTYPQCAAPLNNKASGSCQCSFDLIQDTRFAPNFPPVGIYNNIDSLSSCLSLCDNTFFDCLMGDYDCTTGTCRLYPQGGGGISAKGKIFFLKQTYACAAKPNYGTCTAQPFLVGATSTVSSSSSVISVSASSQSTTPAVITPSTTASIASSSSSSASTLRTVSVNIISTTISVSSSSSLVSTSSSASPSPSVTLGPYGTNACPNPTPVSFTISSKLYNYNMCMGFQAPGSVNMYAADAAACAALCNGNCVAFNFGDPQNCRTMARVDAMTAPFYGWSAYQFVGTAPLPTTTSTPTPSPSPTITVNPFGANACPNPTQTSYTVSNTLYRYNFCMAYMAPGSVNMYAANAPACAALCKGDCVAFNYGDPQNCRTMNRVDAITAPFYGWSAYQLIGSTPLPTATAR